MVSRIAGVLVLTGTIMFSTMGLVQAQPTTSVGGIPKPNAVPEFDTNALGSAIVILAGGLFLLNERHRKNC